MHCTSSSASKRPRSVSFHPDVKGRKYRPKGDKAELFWQPHEFADIRQTIYETVRKLENGIEMDDTESCARGIERLLKKSSVRIVQRRARASDAVLDYQDLCYRQWRLPDEDVIAKLYREIPNESRLDAYAKGINDQLAAGIVCGQFCKGISPKSAARVPSLSHPSKKGRSYKPVGKAADEQRILPGRSFQVYLAKRVLRNDIFKTQ